MGKAGHALADPDVDNRSTSETSQFSSKTPHPLKRGVDYGIPREKSDRCLHCLTGYTRYSNPNSQISLIPEGEAPISYSLAKATFPMDGSSKVMTGSSAQRPEVHFENAGFPKDRSLGTPFDGQPDPRCDRQITWSTDNSGGSAQIPGAPSRAPTMNSSGIQSQTHTMPLSGRDLEASPGISSSRFPEDGSRELHPDSFWGTAKTKWSRISVWERATVIIAAAVVFVTTIVTIVLFRTKGVGHKNFSRLIFMLGILIIMAASGTAMFAVKRNLGEVFFAMILIIALGIFLNSFLDILYAAALG
jgi:hypothetical protein